MYDILDSRVARMLPHLSHAQWELMLPAVLGALGMGGAGAPALLPTLGTALGSSLGSLSGGGILGALGQVGSMAGPAFQSALPSILANVGTAALIGKPRGGGPWTSIETTPTPPPSPPPLAERTPAEMAQVANLKAGMPLNFSRGSSPYSLTGNTPYPLMGGYPFPTTY